MPYPDGKHRYTTVFEKEYTVQVVASEPEEPETPDVVIDQDKDVPQVSLGMDQAELAGSADGRGNQRRRSNRDLCGKGGA